MKNILVSLICGLLGAMIFTVANNLLYSRTIAVVKLDQIIAGHLAEYAEKDLSDDERKDLSQTFATSLDSVIKEMYEKDGITLLVAPAVVSEVPDYTEYVRLEVSRKVTSHE